VGGQYCSAGSDVKGEISPSTAGERMLKYAGFGSGAERMRKLAAMLTLTLGAVYHADSAASYVIRLKNGNEFATNRYWQAGKQIMFDTYGGVFGIEKAFIDAIEASTRPAAVEPSLPKSAERSHETGDTGAAPKSDQTEEGLARTRPAVDADPILKEFYSLKEKFGAFNRMLTSELNDFARDIANFRKRVRQSEKVNNYIEQLAETSAMEDDLAEELRSRSQ
jgi:hypothetical protein